MVLLKLSGRGQTRLLGFQAHWWGGAAAAGAAGRKKLGQVGACRARSVLFPVVCRLSLNG